MAQLVRHRHHLLSLALVALLGCSSGGGAPKDAGKNNDAAHGDAAGGDTTSSSDAQPGADDVAPATDGDVDAATDGDVDALGDGSGEAGCVSQGADLPDDAFTDENCDGIDGDVSKAVFVAVTGDDTNAGTMDKPLLTLDAALARAVADGKRDVYVSTGMYDAHVTLVDGVSIYGGYVATEGWKRSATALVTLTASVVANGRVVAVEGANITTPTTLDRLVIQTPDATGPGVSNYAMYCNTCTGVTLKNSTLTAGAGGPGVAGALGTPGMNGVPGSPGMNGSCDTANGTGGPPGVLACDGLDVSGGRGGDGGPEGTHNGMNGVMGKNGGGTGGLPGNGCDSGCFGPCTATGGGAGIPAAAVGSGGNGSGGLGGMVMNGFWLGGVGANGFSGPHGKGGGGGGGGGGHGGGAVIEGGGNGGGGGGSGGCGGAFGKGGGPGGGSFGLFLVGSTGFVMTTATVSSGKGGNGGPGGDGGKGGDPGGLGSGAIACIGEVGGGGDGGKGSAGGRGGHGGGGAGGPSFGVYLSATTLTFDGSTLMPGAPGLGGASSGMPGTVGTSGAHN